MLACASGLIGRLYQSAHSYLSAGTASKAAVQQDAEAQQQPGGAQDGPVVTAEITCSPLRVLTGQGPSLDRSAPMTALMLHAQMYRFVEAFLSMMSLTVRIQRQP